MTSQLLLLRHLDERLRRRLERSCREAAHARRVRLLVDIVRLRQIVPVVRLLLRQQVLNHRRICKVLLARRHRRQPRRVARVERVLPIALEHLDFRLPNLGPPSALKELVVRRASRLHDDGRGGNVPGVAHRQCHRQRTDHVRRAAEGKREHLLARVDERGFLVRLPPRRRHHFAQELDDVHRRTQSEDGVPHARHLQPIHPLRRQQLGVLIDQHRHRHRMAALGGELERGEAVVVVDVDLRPRLHECLGDLVVAVLCRQAERSVPLLVLTVDVRPRVDERVQRLLVAALR